MNRRSIAALLVIIATLGFGFAAIREGTEGWALAVFSVTFAVLIVAAATGVFRRCGRATWLGFFVCGTGYLLLAFAPWGGLPRPVLPTDRWIDRTLLPFNKNDALPRPIRPSPLTPPTRPALSGPVSDRKRPDSPWDAEDIHKQAAEMVRVRLETAALRDDFQRQKAHFQAMQSYTKALVLRSVRHQEAIRQTRRIGHCFLSLLLGLVGALLASLLTSRGICAISPPEL